MTDIDEIEHHDSWDKIKFTANCRFQFRTIKDSRDLKKFRILYDWGKGELLCCDSQMYQANFHSVQVKQIEIFECT